MGAMAEYEYPDITIKQAIEIIQTIEDNNIQKLEVLATKTGHKGPTAYRGGGFRMKITALLRYGLLTGKPSELRLSDLAKGIVHPRSEDAKNDAIRKAVLSVPILAKMHEKLQGRIPSDFWIPLYDCTSVDQKIVKEHAENIRKLYADAVQYLQTTVETKPVKEEKKEEEKTMIGVPEGSMRLLAPGVDITLEFKPESLKIIRAWLDQVEKGYEKGGKPEK